MASRFQIDRLHISAGHWTDSAVRQMYKQALDEGADDERARLRPLLEECLEVIDQYAPGFTVLILDLRAELGADHPTPPPE